MREFLSEVYDAAELRSQRQSLISQSLDQKTLDQISLKAGLIPDGEGPQEAAERRQKLLSSIEVFPLQSSDFQVSVTSADRERGLLINQEVLSNILSVLKNKRMRGLENLRAAIGVQLDSMAAMAGLSTNTQRSFMSVTSLKMKLEQLEQDLDLKRARFSPSHPALVAQVKELENLKKIYELALNRPTNAPAQTGDTNPYKVMATNPENAVYNDLSRKYSYLSIVLLAEAGPDPTYFSVVRSPELPPFPIWPKRSLFLIWSVLLGTLAAFAYVALKEYVNIAPGFKSETAEGLPLFAGALKTREFTESEKTSSARPQADGSHL